MKKITISFSIFIFIIISFHFHSDKIIAQQAGWIEQELPQSMMGAPLAERGDDLLIYTNNVSDRVYFFDTKINSWTEAILGSQQTFRKVLASGNTAFGYSDEYIIAYSSIKSEWDSVKYQGNVLNPTGVSVQKGFGCGDKLAYFVTDANIFYVFDSELAEWKEYNFGIVNNASGYNNFWATDNYAGAILQRNGTDYAKNIAYSFVTHSFAELDQGGWYYYPDNIMHGGYVSLWSNAISVQKYFGYSAFTNQFNTITFPSGIGINAFNAWIDHTSYNRLEDIYVYTCGYEVGDQIHRDVFVKSYSTKTGNWYSFQYSYDPREASGTGWKKGGGFSLGYYINDADQSVSIWKFYGLTGTHIGENTGLFGSQPLFVHGGKVSVGSGDHNLWFHNFETSHTVNKYFAPSDDYYYVKHLGAENYCTVFRVNKNSDTMKIFFFNGKTDKLQWIDTYKLPNSVAKATTEVYGYVTGGPDNEVILYSEKNDSVMIYNASETIAGILYAKNSLIGLTITTGNSMVFDASTMQIYEKNFSLTSSNIGKHLLFTRSGDNELTGYSTITKNWTQKQTDQSLLGYFCGDEVALGVSYLYAKYWGYSARNDKYYELVPEGNYVSPFSLCGGKTALVIRTTKIYAFSPEGVSSVKDEMNLEINNFSLSQNFPNPFNPKTKIKYVISSREHTILKVYNVLGIEIAVLVNEERSPGEYEIEFDAAGLSSGIYFYQLKAGDYNEAKKMLLLK